MAQRFFAPKLSPDASKSQNSLLNSLIAGKSCGDGRDQHCDASQAVWKPEKVPLKGEKGPLLAAFCNSAPVSEFPNRRTCRLFREKSPATTANIPIFGRLSLETRFDLHCVRDAAVAFAIFSDPYRASWGTPVLNCRLTVALRFGQFSRTDRADLVIFHWTATRPWHSNVGEPDAPKAARVSNTARTVRNRVDIRKIRRARNKCCR